MRARAGLMLLGTILTLLGPRAASAGQPVVVAGPLAFIAGWTTQVVVHAVGQPLQLQNLDAAFHSIESEAFGPDDAPWCGPVGPGNARQYPLGHCPLFWSALTVPLTGFAPVQGLGGLEPGRAYAFSCRVFPEMEGVLITL